MRTLFNETRTKTDIYSYAINSGGEFLIQERGGVEIIFVNDKFSSASFPFQGAYTRNGWRILAGINEKIAEIESRISERKTP